MKQLILPLIFIGSTLNSSAFAGSLFAFVTSEKYCQYRNYGATHEEAFKTAYYEGKKTIQFEEQLGNYSASTEYITVSGKKYLKTDIELLDALNLKCRNLLPLDLRTVQTY